MNKLDEPRETRRRLRYPQAIHGLMLAVAALLFLIAYILNSGVFYDSLINLAGGLFVVAAVFYLVDQFFDWQPYEERFGLILNRMESVLSNYPREIDPYLSKTEIYNALIRALDDGWEQIYIFAPSGFWREDADKKRWLEALVTYKLEQPSVYVWMIYGLPPWKKNSEDRREADVEQDLNRVFQNLKPISGVERTRIHYYPPTEASVGLGAALFEKPDRSGLFSLALACHADDEVIDRGFLLNSDEVFPDALNWLKDKIFLRATTSYVLQDGDGSFEERWRSVVQKHYDERFPGMSERVLPQTENAPETDT